jgi:hypothetical protein
VGQPFFNELWSRRFHRLAQIQDGADPAKTVVTPNGAAVDRFTALGRVPSEPDEFRVEFVGRVVPIKGLKRFVRTFRIVVESIPDTRATIVWPMDENWSHWPAGYFFFFGFFVSLRMPVPFAIALTPSRVMYQGSGAKLLLNSATTRRRPPQDCWSPVPPLPACRRTADRSELRPVSPRETGSRRAGRRVSLHHGRHLIGRRSVRRDPSGAREG